MIGGIGTLLSQTVGDAVHGGVGNAISSIGSDASIGAGMGAFFGPEGIAGGAILGGLVGTFTTLFHNRSLGQQAADALTPGFGGKHRANLQSQVAGAVDALKKYETVSRTVLGPRGERMNVPVQLAISQLDPAQQAKAVAAANKAGRLVAAQLQAGWSQYKFQSEPVMFSGLRAEIKKLPPEAQAASIAFAVKFAQGLERSGRLTKGSAGKMLSQAESAFPGFEQYMGLAAGAGIKQFNRALDLSKAEAGLKGTLHKMGDDFSIVQDAMSHTTGTIQTKSAAAIKALLKIQANGTAPARRQATIDLAILRQSTTNDLTKMSAGVDAWMRDMSYQLGPNLLGASNTARHHLDDFVQHVKDAMNRGAVATTKGMALIISTINNALAQEGQKRLTGLQVGSLTLGVAKQRQLAGRGYAMGGLIQVGRHGEKGIDSVPLDVSGTPILVAPGEQVGVFTPSQQAFLATRLADVGGLAGVFKHFKAGGIVNPISSSAQPRSSASIPSFGLGSQLVGLDHAAGAAAATVRHLTAELAAASKTSSDQAALQSQLNAVENERVKLEDRKTTAKSKTATGARGRARGQRGAQAGHRAAAARRAHGRRRAQDSAQRPAQGRARPAAPQTKNTPPQCSRSHHRTTSPPPAEPRSPARA